MLDSVQWDCAELIWVKSEKHDSGMYTNSSNTLIALTRLTVGHLYYLQGLYYSINPGGESSSLEKKYRFFQCDSL
jgi:hypothetical protein